MQNSANIAKRELACNLCPAVVGRCREYDGSLVPTREKVCLIFWWEIAVRPAQGQHTGYRSRVERGVNRVGRGRARPKPKLSSAHIARTHKRIACARRDHNPKRANRRMMDPQNICTGGILVK